jgi:hypothetical protein
MLLYKKESNFTKELVVKLKNFFQMVLNLMVKKELNNLIREYVLI